MKRILVIDDEGKLRQHYGELLRLEGFEVIEARGGREGIERARQEAPDLVLCDVTMPEINGHRVLEVLRGDPLTAHLPFVFLTGCTAREDMRTGMNLGADDYLTKPATPDELLTAVRARLRRAEAATPPGRRRAGREAVPADLAPLGLTPRESEVLLWVARGKTNDEIATVLGIGLTTVKKHLESTYAKLGVENRTTAAAMALERIGAG
ncbi:MAG: response regulator transcription factor [Opitutaceae bacterium]|nr:response regulator transcription factor [Opitutaceae bacterium]